MGWVTHFTDVNRSVPELVYLRFFFFSSGLISSRSVTLPPLGEREREGKREREGERGGGRGREGEREGGGEKER